MTGTDGPEENRINEKKISEDDPQNSQSSSSENYLSRWKFECKSCGRQFTKKCDLTTHKRLHLTNSDPRKFGCNICGAFLSSLRGFKYHEKTHLDDNIPEQAAIKRPFKCDECGRGFLTARKLKLHTLTHASVNDPELLALKKRHECSDCGKGFIRPNDLRKHSRIHSRSSSSPIKKFAKKKPEYVQLSTTGMVISSEDTAVKTKTMIDNGCNVLSSIAEMEIMPDVAYIAGMNADALSQLLKLSEESLEPGTCLVFFIDIVGAVSDSLIGFSTFTDEDIFHNEKRHAVGAIRKGSAELSATDAIMPEIMKRKIPLKRIMPNSLSTFNNLSKGSKNVLIHSMKKDNVLVDDAGFFLYVVE